VIELYIRAIFRFMPEIVFIFKKICKINMYSIFYFNLLAKIRINLFY
jgi:hypothetical protein